MKRNREKLLEMKLAYKKRFIDSVNRGLADADAGRVHSTKEVREELRKCRQQRSSG